MPRETKTERLTVRVEPDVRTLVERIAEEEGRSISDVVARLLREAAAARSAK